MKIPDCFEAYRPLALVAASLILAGCDSGGVSAGSGSGGGCASNIPAPTNFEERFDTFTIDENTQENPAGADLERTLFRQFFKAAKPAPDEGQSADDIYAFISEETDSIAHFGDINNLPEYNSVRNDFDLIEAMITASSQFESLQLARDAMASCARDTQQAITEGEDGKPGSARIGEVTVTEKSNDADADPESWSYFVNYAHNPKPLDDTTPFGPNVARLIVGPTAVIFSLYKLEQFTGSSAATGFKQPGRLTVGFNATPEETIGEDDGEGDNDDQDNNEPSIFFESFPLKDTQDDRGQDRGETDRWEWSSKNAHDIETPDDGTIAAKCVRLTVDYSDNNQAKVEIGDEPCPDFNEPTPFNPIAEFSYTSANPNTLQTR